MSEPQSVVAEDAANNLEECSICLIPIYAKFTTTNVCTHIFHGICLKKWCEQRQACPLCRTEITTLTHHDEGKIIGNEELSKDENENLEFDEYENTFCQLCGTGNDSDEMLLCDGCDRGFHTYCLEPRMDEIPDGDWYCSDCAPRFERETTTVTTRGSSRRGIGRTALVQNLRSHIQQLLRGGVDELRDSSEEEDNTDNEEIDSAMEESPDEEQPGPSRRNVSENFEEDDRILEDLEDVFENLPKVERKKRGRTSKKITKTKRRTGGKTSKKTKGRRRRSKKSRRGDVSASNIYEELFGRKKTKEERELHRFTYANRPLSLTSAGTYPLFEVEENPRPKAVTDRSPQDDATGSGPIDLLGDILSSQSKVLAPARLFTQKGAQLVAKKEFTDYVMKKEQQMDQGLKKALGIEDSRSIEEMVFSKKLPPVRIPSLHREHGNTEARRSHSRDRIRKKSVTDPGAPVRFPSPRREHGNTEARRSRSRERVQHRSRTIVNELDRRIDGASRRDDHRRSERQRSPEKRSTTQDRPSRKCHSRDDSRSVNRSRNRVSSRPQELESRHPRTSNDYDNRCSDREDKYIPKRSKKESKPSLFSTPSIFGKALTQNLGTKGYEIKPVSVSNSQNDQKEQILNPPERVLVPMLDTPLSPLPPPMSPSPQQDDSPRTLSRSSQLPAELKPVNETDRNLKGFIGWGGISDSNAQRHDPLNKVVGSVLDLKQVEAIAKPIIIEHCKKRKAGANVCKAILRKSVPEIVKKQYRVGDEVRKMAYYYAYEGVKEVKNGKNRKKGAFYYFRDGEETPW